VKLRGFILFKAKQMLKGYGIMELLGLQIPHRAHLREGVHTSALKLKLKITLKNRASALES
jgi:hypothetical protein